MPLATIWRDRKLVNDKTAVQLRNLVNVAVATACKMKSGDVEVRIRNIGTLDMNAPPFSVEIDTGSGKRNWRIKARDAIAKHVAKEIAESGILPKEWLGPHGPYVWARVFYSRFVPIGHPELAK
ncbi:MAG: hypothetical protein NUV53_01805 [Patescibacteria group bacterium]|nr:hypothetical protein [Patescibacteria group bacterium]